MILLQERAVVVIRDQVKTMCHKSKKSDFRSTAHRLMLVKCLNMMFELNELLNSRSSIKNDYASYNR